MYIYILIIDINECVLNIDLCEHTCTNTVDSYQCSCNTGYHLESNGYNCTGIMTSVFIIDKLTLDTNECNTQNGGCNHTCVNEIGSFHCECSTGYTLADDGFGCTGIVYTVVY